MSSNDPTDDEPTYRVGRGRPPLHSRFKKGQSGNPGGRKRGCRNIKTLMEEAQELTVAMNVGGMQRQVSLPLALVFAQGQAGLKGDMRAVEYFLNRYERLGVGEESERQDNLAGEDLIILERSRQRMARSLTDHEAGIDPCDDGGSGDV